MMAVAIFDAEAMAQSGFWSGSSVPGTAEVTNDTAAVTLGLKFYSDVPGTITAVRFYKGAHNTGTHIGNIWSATGSKLASVTFTGEAPSGWQQAAFSSPLSITANTTYIVSYLAPKGYYANDQYFSWSTLNAAPLHVSGSAPGTYAYGSTPAVPTSTWNKSNYWVDVIFVPGTQPVPSTYSISGNAGGSGATLTLSGAASGLLTSDASGGYSFTGIPNGSYVVAPNQSGYSFTPTTASVTVNGGPMTGVNFARAVLPTPVPHTVSLNWTPSTSSNVVGYNVYRTAVPGGSYSKLNTSPVAAAAYADTAVVSGYTYYYVATAVDSTNAESGYSNQAIATVPNP